MFAWLPCLVFLLILFWNLVLFTDMFSSETGRNNKQRFPSQVTTGSSLISQWFNLWLIFGQLYFHCKFKEVQSICCPFMLYFLVVYLYYRIPTVLNVHVCLEKRQFHKIILELRQLENEMLLCTFGLAL